ncbi:MAG: protein kinase domain-containing protein [Myxococcales bacterium]
MEGKILAGRYRLLRKLGQGGMGAVWRAEHITLGTPVAIKLIDASIADSTDALMRFKREAQSAAELHSTHVVHILDYGVDQLVPYIAMELLEGESLAVHLARVGRLAPPRVAEILSQVGRALSRAHAAGIVHRDLKPENIFLVSEEDEEIVKVLDFGIAKRVNALSVSGGVKTSTGALLGSPLYMSPEQARGHATVDHRTDIWSLAVIAYQCITGSRPFCADTLGALLFSICSDPMPVPSAVAEVPPGFDAWFARAAARDPAARFSSANEAVAELRRVCCPKLTGESVKSAASYDSMTAGSTAPLTSASAVTPADLGQTAIPSSITVSAGSRVRSRLVLGGAATAGVLVAVTALRSLQVTKDETLTAQPSAAEQRASGSAPLALGAEHVLAPGVPASAYAPLVRDDTNQTSPTQVSAPPPIGVASATNSVASATNSVASATSAGATESNAATPVNRRGQPATTQERQRAAARSVSAAAKGRLEQGKSKAKKDLTLDQKAGF